MPGSPLEPLPITHTPSHDLPPQEEAPQSVTNSPGPAAWPHSYCTQPQAHALLGPKDTNRHDNEGTEAAGADTSQHHNESNKGLAAETKAAFTVGSSCRNKATRPGASQLPEDLRSTPPQRPLGGHKWLVLPGEGRGCGWGGCYQEKAPAAGASNRDRHINTRGLPAEQESGWGQAAMSSPQPRHTPLDGTHWKVLTSQWGCEAEGVGAGPRTTSLA